MSGIEYRPEIDGLRAVAVIPVLIFHMWPTLLRGGFLGVDVFFVISGFLISSIIKDELERKSFSFRSFWARRVRRILPALLAVTAATLLTTFFFIFRPDQQAIASQAVATLFSVANIYFWRTAGDYWGNAAEYSPFLHAWSLAVEEQFYMLFPLMIYALYNFRARWVTLGIFSGVAISLVMFIWGLYTHPTSTFYLLPTRAWEIGIGCLLANIAYGRSFNSPKFAYAGTIGLGIIIISYIFVKSLGLGVLATVTGTVFVLAFGRSGLSFKLLSHNQVVHIGKISYSLYLWHWPIIVIGKHVAPTLQGLPYGLSLLTLIFALANASYFFIEKPFRRQKGAVKPLLLSLVCLACFALWMASTPRFYDTTKYATPIYFPHNCHPNPTNNQQTTILFATTQVRNSGWHATAYLESGIRMTDKEGTPTIVVLGDSHGSMWSNAVATAAKQLGQPATSFCMEVFPHS